MRVSPVMWRSGADRRPSRVTTATRGTCDGSGKATSPHPWLLTIGVPGYLTEHAGYAGHLLGPQLVSSFGLGFVFVPLALSPCTRWPSSTPVSPPACSTPPSRPAGRSGLPCSAPSPGRPSRTASALRSRVRRRTPRRRASHSGSRAHPRRRPSTITQPAALQAGTVQLHEDRAVLAAAVRPCRLC